MLQISAQSKVYIAVEPADFRKGIDALAAVCQQILKQDPYSGAMFVFSNRQKTAIKILLFDGQGMWMAIKRLSKGKFQWWPKQNQTTYCLRPSQLQVLLWNGNPVSAQIEADWRKIV
jgi:transposase